MASLGGLKAPAQAATDEDRTPHCLSLSLHSVATLSVMGVCHIKHARCIVACNKGIYIKTHLEPSPLRGRWREASDEVYYDG